MNAYIASSGTKQLKKSHNFGFMEALRSGSMLDLPFFAKFFAKNLFTFFAFFAKKRGAKNARNAKKICYIFGYFDLILMFLLPKCTVLGSRH